MAMETGNEYDKEPVVFCKGCLSLRILSVGGVDYCDECGSTELGEKIVSEWEELYRMRYGKPYITRRDGRKKERRGSW